MTHDRISHELAQLQLPLVVASFYNDDEWSTGDDDTIGNLAGAINHARLTGMAQLLVSSSSFSNPCYKEEREEKFNSNTRALFDALALPDEQLDFAPLKCVGDGLYVFIITRKTKGEEQPASSAEPAP